MFSFKKKKTNLSIGLTSSEKGIAFAIVEHHSSGPVLIHAAFHPCTLAEQASALRELSRQYHFDSHPCNFILNADEYQLLQVEAPDVPRDEWHSALRWQIKDSLTLNPDDIVIEYIQLAHDITTSGTKALQVIACQQSLIQSRVDLLHDSGCQLNTIDIAVMTSRNIISRLKTINNQESIGVLSLRDTASRISVLVDNELYINRSSSIGLEQLAFVSEVDVISHNILDSLSLELQRTFDYYESHYRQSAITQLFILTHGQMNPVLLSMLEERIGIQCFVVKLTDFITVKDGAVPEDIMANCLVAVGGALRENSN